MDMRLLPHQRPMPALPLSSISQGFLRLLYLFHISSQRVLRDTRTVTQKSKLLFQWQQRLYMSGLSEKIWFQDSFGNLKSTSERNRDSFLSCEHENSFSNTLWMVFRADTQRSPRRIAQVARIGFRCMRNTNN